MEKSRKESSRTESIYLPGTINIFFITEDMLLEYKWQVTLIFLLPFVVESAYQGVLAFAFEFQAFSSLYPDIWGNKSF